MMRASKGAVAMRVTAEIDEVSYQHVRRRARLENISMGALLGELIRQSLQTQPLSLVKSGRFEVIAALPGAAREKSEAIQQAIDYEGLL